MEHGGAEIIVVCPTSVEAIVPRGVFFGGSKAADLDVETVTQMVPAANSFSA
jgi:hypothetical protein